jgi:hypothetical protein
MPANSTATSRPETDFHEPLLPHPSRGLINVRLHWTETDLTQVVNGRKRIKYAARTIACYWGAIRKDDKTGAKIHQWMRTEAGRIE